MGSKKRSAQAIVSTFPNLDNGGTYFEPFLGGGSVYFAYEPVRAVLGDANTSLMNAWTWIRNDAVVVREAVSRLHATESTYYEVRASRPPKDSLESAVNFVYLNRYCFNGIYRTNRDDEFNVPFGKNTGSLPSTKAFVACANAMTAAELVAGDFSKTIEGAEAGDVVYMDPPWQTTRANYGEYGYSDHQPVTPERILLESLKLYRRGVRVYISLPFEMSATFKSWHLADVDVHYNVASKQSARSRKTEMLISLADSTSLERNIVNA